MEIIYILSVILLSVGVSLGVGTSTAAIAGFLVAISDKTIDKSERRLLKIIFVLLRIAMVIFAVTLITLYHFFPGAIELVNYLAVLLVILIVNAVLMTKHLISGKIGPALQAATWYMLGITMAIESFNLVTLTPKIFVATYILLAAVVALIVNMLMCGCLNKK